MLARDLGYPHPDYLMRYLTSKQVADWIACYKVDPWGEYRADLRSGIVTSTIANVNRGKDTPPFKISDFMPKFHEDDHPDQRTLKAKLQDIFKSIKPKKRNKDG